MAEEKKNIPLATTTSTTTTAQQTDLPPPPAYASPILPPTQDSQQQPQAPQTQSQSQSQPPPLPPPQYKPKRTPSQEAIYMSELKAWAAEKEKMYEGAYGEYFGKLVDPGRVPRWRWDEWHRLGGDVAVSRDSTATAGAKQSRVERDEATDRELRELLARPVHTLSMGESSRSGGSTAAAAPAATVESMSAPKEGFMKRRMSNFLNKIKKHEVESEPGDQEAALRARDELVAQELARQRQQQLQQS